MRPQVVVCPKERKIIPYKIVGNEEQPLIDFRVVASFKKDSEELIQTALNKGNKFKRY
jgi:hypothetical protein